MPVWTTPETSPAERIVASHKELTGKDPVRCADAPGTWILIGENVDHYGGVTIVGLTHLRAAAAFSERDDDTINLVFRAPGKEITSQTTLSEVAQLATTQTGDEKSSTSDLELATRYAGIVHTLMTRQLLSRETPGLDITIESDIPMGSGLGAMYAADAALALALVGDAADIDEAPMRTRLAEVCSQSVDTFSPMPVLRARHTVGLRGTGETVSVVDYSDGSVTQAPHPVRSGVEIFAIAKSLGKPDSSQAELIAQRRAFIDEACHNFGTESLRELPDAVTRVVDWMNAVHQVRGPEGQPTLQQAQDWMTFSESETLRSLAVAKALRSRHTDDLFHLLNTPYDNHGLDTPDQLVQLVNLRGARAARPAAAGMSQAVTAFVPMQKANNFSADLAEDGFQVIPIQRGEVARVLGAGEDAGSDE